MNKRYIVTECPIDHWNEVDPKRPISIQRCWCGRDITIHGITVQPNENGLVTLINEEDKSIAVCTSDQPGNPKILGFPGQMEFTCNIGPRKIIWPNHNSHEAIIIRPETPLDRIKSFFSRRPQL